MYCSLRRISETLPHFPIDNTIRNTNFIMLCSLHIGAVHMLFLNQMQSLPSFSVGRNKCHTHVTIGGRGCKLLRFFASSLVYFVMERNVFFMIKKMFLSHCSSVKIIVNNVAWYLPASRFIFILNKGQQIRRSMLIFLQNPPFRRYFCKTSNPQYC